MLAALDTAPQAPPQDTTRAHVAAYLRDTGANPDDVYQAIYGLDAEGLRPYGVDACHLNLVSLLGRRWPAGRVREAAAECARNRLWRGWEFAAEADGWARSPGADAGGPALAGWDAGTIRRLQGRGPGVMVCGFHFGSWRYVPADLGRLGFATTFAVDTRLMDDGEWGGTDRPTFGGRLGVAGIDDPASLVGLVRAVRGGGVAYLNVDGHRGWGVGHGEQSFCTVRFMGASLRVMTGVARIAAANGAALLPVIAVPDGRRRGRAVCGEPILPPAGGGAGWISEAMQALFGFFEPYVEADPAEWQDVRFLHRWRAPEAADPERWNAELDGLAAGRRLRLDEGRCVRVGDGSTLVDARTLRGLRIPPWAAGMMAAMEAREGVGAEWLDARFAGEPRRDAAALLATLVKNGLVRDADD